MRIVIIRHGEPDYSIDSLTEKGWKEASLVADRLIKTDAAGVYCSPLGRARDTMKPYIELTKKDYEICDWLEEFTYEQFVHPETNQKTFIWDFHPRFLDENIDFYDKNKWLDIPFIKESNVASAIDKVYNGLDELLKKYGYERNGSYYKVLKESHETIYLFCHFGVESVLLSHLFNCSPQVVSHNFIALPTSVTTLISEEREQGKAYFRCQQFGDISHLYAAGEEPSFAGRWCECFSDPERH